MLLSSKEALQVPSCGAPCHPMRSPHTAARHAALPCQQCSRLLYSPHAALALASVEQLVLAGEEVVGRVLPAIREKNSQHKVDRGVSCYPQLFVAHRPAAAGLEPVHSTGQAPAPRLTRQTRARSRAGVRRPEAAPARWRGPASSAAIEAESKLWQGVACYGPWK